MYLYLNTVENWYLVLIHKYFYSVLMTSLELLTYSGAGLNLQKSSQDRTVFSIISRQLDSVVKNFADFIFHRFMSILFPFSYFIPLSPFCFYVVKRSRTCSLGGALRIFVDFYCLLCTVRWWHWRIQCTRFDYWDDLLSWFCSRKQVNQAVSCHYLIAVTFTKTENRRRLASSPAPNISDKNWPKPRIIRLDAGAVCPE